MTMLLAINFGDYGILAADKAVSNHNGEIIGRNENKIIQTQIGYLTGTGEVSLLNSVKNKIAEVQITNTDQIISLIKEKRIKFLNDVKTLENVLKYYHNLNDFEKSVFKYQNLNILNYLNLDYQESYDLIKRLEETGYGTSFMYTYRTTDGLRIGFQSPKNIENLSMSKEESLSNALIIQKNEFWLNPPFKYCEKTYHDSRNKLKEMKNHKRNKSKEIKLVKEIFKEMALNSEGITPECDYYVF